jgi:predicted CoA-binding protein
VIVGYSKELSGSRLLGTVDIVRQIFWITLYNLWSWKSVVKYPNNHYLRDNKIHCVNNKCFCESAEPKV